MALRLTNGAENRPIRLETWGRMASCAPIGNRRSAFIHLRIRAGSVSGLVWPFTLFR